MKSWRSPTALLAPPQLRRRRQHDDCRPADHHIAEHPTTERCQPGPPLAAGRPASLCALPGPLRRSAARPGLCPAARRGIDGPGPVVGVPPSLAGRGPPHGQGRCGCLALPGHLQRLHRRPAPRRHSHGGVDPCTPVPRRGLRAVPRPPPACVWAWRPCRRPSVSRSSWSTARASTPTRAVYPRPACRWTSGTPWSCLELKPNPHLPEAEAIFDPDPELRRPTRPRCWNWSRPVLRRPEPVVAVASEPGAVAAGASEPELVPRWRPNRTPVAAGASEPATATTPAPRTGHRQDALTRTGHGWGVQTPNQRTAKTPPPRRATAKASRPQPAEASRPEPATAEASDPNQLRLRRPDPNQLRLRRPDPNQLRLRRPDPNQLRLRRPDPNQLRAEASRPEPATAEASRPEPATAEASDPNQLRLRRPDPNRLTAAASDPNQLRLAASADPNQPPPRRPHPNRPRLGRPEPEPATAEAPPRRTSYG